MIIGKVEKSIELDLTSIYDPVNCFVDVLTIMGNTSLAAKGVDLRIAPSSIQTSFLVAQSISDNEITKHLMRIDDLPGVIEVFNDCNDLDVKLSEEQFWIPKRKDAISNFLISMINKVEPVFTSVSGIGWINAIRGISSISQRLHAVLIYGYEKRSMFSSPEFLVYDPLDSASLYISAQNLEILGEAYKDGEWQKNELIFGTLEAVHEV